MFQLVSTIVAASLIAIALSSPAQSPIEVKSGFEFIGTVEGKVLLRPLNAAQNENMSYQDALIKCNSAGYRIATIESEAQHAIVEPYSCQGYVWYWIDGVAFQTPNNFFSITTGRNLTYFDWAPNRPVKGDGNRRCLRTSCNAMDGLAMWDVSCTDKYSVICQVST